MSSRHIHLEHQFFVSKACFVLGRPSPRVRELDTVCYEIQGPGSERERETGLLSY